MCCLTDCLLYSNHFVWNGRLKSVESSFQSPCVTARRLQELRATFVVWNAESADNVVTTKNMKHYETLLQLLSLILCVHTCTLDSSFELMHFFLHGTYDIL